MMKLNKIFLLVALIVCVRVSCALLHAQEPTLNPAENPVMSPQNLIFQDSCAKFEAFVNSLHASHFMNGGQQKTKLFTLLGEQFKTLCTKMSEHELPQALTEKFNTLCNELFMIYMESDDFTHSDMQAAREAIQKFTTSLTHHRAMVDAQSAQEDIIDSLFELTSTLRIVTNDNIVSSGGLTGALSSFFSWIGNHPRTTLATVGGIVVGALLAQKYKYRIFPERDIPTPHVKTAVFACNDLATFRKQDAKDFDYDALTQEERREICIQLHDPGMLSEQRGNMKPHKRVEAIIKGAMDRIKAQEDAELEKKAAGALKRFLRKEIDSPNKILDKAMEVANSNADQSLGDLVALGKTHIKNFCETGCKSHIAELRKTLKAIGKTAVRDHKDLVLFIGEIDPELVSADNANTSEEPSIDDTENTIKDSLLPASIKLSKLRKCAEVVNDEALNAQLTSLEQRLSSLNDAAEADQTSDIEQLETEITQFDTQMNTDEVIQKLRVHICNNIPSNFGYKVLVPARLFRKADGSMQDIGAMDSEVEKNVDGYNFDLEKLVRRGDKNSAISNAIYRAALTKLIQEIESPN